LAFDVRTNRAQEVVERRSFTGNGSVEDLAFDLEGHVGDRPIAPSVPAEIAGVFVVGPCSDPDT